METRAARRRAKVGASKEPLREVYNTSSKDEDLLQASLDVHDIITTGADIMTGIAILVFVVVVIAIYFDDILAMVVWVLRILCSLLNIAYSHLPSTDTIS